MRWISVFATMLTAHAAVAAVQTEEIAYEGGGVAMKGFIAYDDAAEGKRPGVLVVHEWWGHNDHARNAAAKLAEAGYVALAVDMYGDGKTAAHPEDAGKFATAVMSDLDAMTARFAAALQTLKARPEADGEKIAAIGYCFGGAVVLNMARQGQDLDAVVSFHGSLGTQTPAAAGAVKAKVLVLTGAADPMIPPAHIEAFKAEMDAAGADYEVVAYEGVKHSFTNPDADSHGIDALAYDAEADAKSWAAMLALLSETF